jgi:hypothetical protein|tara:strand:- start:16543 stop:16971 length:429 start_codon:yes stop_codon:yes gene_type:complete
LISQKQFKEIKMARNISMKELRKIIMTEAKELTSVKGIKDDKSDSWGGQGNAKVGLKGAYGGTGSSSGEAFGGGKLEGDPISSRAAMKSVKEQRMLGIPNMDELGTVVSYNLLEDGSVCDYDVRFGTKIVRNIPANRLHILS